jgi:hypothetical protein
MLARATLLLILAPGLQAADGTERRYDWLTQGERSGSLVTRIDADGGRRSEFSFSDRGRGPELVETATLDARGLLRELHVAGRSYLGAPVDERFQQDDTQARWTTTLDQGQRETDTAAFYAAAEGTPDQLGMLARALLQAEGHRLPLLPAGEAHIEALHSERFTHNEVTTEATLYAISGLGFTPSFVWLDAQRELFGISYGWMGLLPEGQSALFDSLRSHQERAEDALLRQRASQLTERLPERWCLTNVRWLDVDSGRLSGPASLRVSAGLIDGVDTPDKFDCRGAKTFDGGGRIVLPGLWDMHAHLSAPDGLMNIAAGVTGARDMANDHAQILRLAEQFGSGELIGPRVQRSGFIDKKSPYTAPTGAPVDTLDEALAQIDTYATQGYPLIKIYSSIAPEWVKPMAERIHQRGMRLAGHIPAFLSTEQAVRDGFDEITHINMLFLNFVSTPETDSRTPQRFQLVAEKGGDVDLDSAEVAAFIALLKERNTVVDPTVSIFDQMFRHRSGQPSPILAGVIGHLPPEVQRSALAGRMAIDDGNAARYARSADALLKMIRKLHQAGVRLVPGTDNIVGFTLHRELELYVQAGIPAAEVIRLATAGAADVAALPVKVGRIAPGYAADLLVVDGDPLQDIRDLRRGVLVTRGDRAYRPDAIWRSLGVKPFAPGLR